MVSKMTDEKRRSAWTRIETFIGKRVRCICIDGDLGTVLAQTDIFLAIASLHVPASIY